jgi:integrase
MQSPLPVGSAAFGKALLVHLKVPSYRHHKARNLAVVKLNGKDFYLGRYNSAESREAYERLIAEWLLRNRKPPQPPPPDAAHPGKYLVNDLILAYLDHAELKFVSADGRRSREVESMKLAFRPLKTLYGRLPAAEFSPLKLDSVQKLMIQKDLCHGVINQRVGYIKRMFKWAASREVLPQAVFQALETVDAVSPGRFGVRASKKVQPVSDAYVDAIIPFLPPTLQCMLTLQRLTGMRSGELVQLRGCDIDMTGETWLYLPEHHKTESSSGEKQIPLGPRCREALKPFLRANVDAPLFSPRQAEEERRQIKRAARKTRVQPSQQSRAKPFRARAIGERYDTRSYFQALRYAMERAHKAGLLAREHFWHPHQLRHSVARRLRSGPGIDAARVYLGHATPNMTAMYAGRDLNVAIEVATQFG